MNRYGDVMEDGGLRFVRLLPRPIERVWAYLTEPEKRALWFCGGETAKEPGGKVEFRFNNATLTPHDDPPPKKYKGADGPIDFEGEVRVYDPPRLLSMTWPDKDGSFGLVTFHLSEDGDKVKLEVTHEGIKTPEDLLGASGGWHAHLDILEDKLTDRIPEPFWETHQKAEAEYEARFKEALEKLRAL